MAESSRPAPLANDRPDLLLRLLATLRIAVVERDSAGVFRLACESPKWLQALLPESSEQGSALELLDRFPLLESFLPEAEEVWQAGTSARVESEIWTENVGGRDLHLKAWAASVDGRCLLILEPADAIHHERQIAMQYAHETALQYETIARLNQEVERATRAKSEFLATMSHEIRTPMNAILGMAELLGESELTADQRKYVEIFRRAGSNLLNLINDILDLSKVESGSVTLESIDFDLHDVIARVAELVRIKAGEKGLSVACEIAPDVPRMLVGDPTRLRQIILNLLGNSMKFTETGGLSVRVHRDPDSEDVGFLRFGIQDTGIGIPQDKLGSIFQSFTQADSSTTRKYGGTGLGLSISKKFVELMGGRIWVESSIGSGSTFFFTARFGLSQVRPAVIALSASAVPPSSCECPAARILLADDAEDNRFLIRAYLKDTPCVLDFAENGEVAMQKIKSGDYDLALMDVHMPVMDGYTATEHVREFEIANGKEPLPILALTADAFQDAIDKSHAAGFTAHLTKPIRKPTLLEAISKYARRGMSVGAVPKVRVEVDAALADIVPQYLANLRTGVATILEALKHSDYPAVQTIGHNMKGTGLAYGFEEVTNIGAVIEQAAKGRNVGVIEERTAALMQYLANVAVEYR